MENEAVLAVDKTVGFKLQWLRRTLTSLSSFLAVGTCTRGICSPDTADVSVTVQHNPPVSSRWLKGRMCTAGLLI